MGRCAKVDYVVDSKYARVLNMYTWFWIKFSVIGIEQGPEYAPSSLGDTLLLLLLLLLKYYPKEKMLNGYFWNKNEKMKM